jgi:hypothetical protein
MVKTITNEKIAKSWELWQEYADPTATMTKEQFDEMTFDERFDLLVECFGEDEPIRATDCSAYPCDSCMHRRECSMSDC